jgi:hypothetical protein
MATTIQDLEERVDALYNSILQMQQNLNPVIEKADDTAIKVEQITPYTETKTAYFNEKEKTFYNVPSGNVTVLFDNYNGNYSVSRVADRVTVSFDTLTEQTNITISIK